MQYFYGRFHCDKLPHIVWQCIATEAMNCVLISGQRWKSSITFFFFFLSQYVHVQKLTLKSINPLWEIFTRVKSVTTTSPSWLPLAAQTRHMSLKVFNLLLMKIKHVQIKDNEWWKYMTHMLFKKCSMYIIILYKPCWHFKSHIYAAIVK